MSRFEYRLHRILELREGTERDRARRMGDAQAEAVVRRNTLETSQRALADAERQVSDRSRGSACAGELQALHAVRDGLGADASRDAAASAAADQAVDQARVDFDSARRDRRVLERLKEQRFAAWQVEESRAEQRLMDEHAQSKRGSHSEIA